MFTLPAGKSTRALGPVFKRRVHVAVAVVAALAFSGCAVITVAGAATGAAISVAGAVVSTGVSMTGKAIGKTIDAVTPGDK